MTVLGQIACDSTGKLNAQSVVLAGDRSHSGGGQIPLDLSELTEFSLFPGQVRIYWGGAPSCSPNVEPNCAFLTFFWADRGAGGNQQHREEDDGDQDLRGDAAGRLRGWAGKGRVWGHWWFFRRGFPFPSTRRQSRCQVRAGCPPFCPQNPLFVPKPSLLSPSSYFVPQVPDFCPPNCPFFVPNPPCCPQISSRCSWPVAPSPPRMVSPSSP